MSDPKPIEPVSLPDPTVKPPAPITPPAADGGISGIAGGTPQPGKELRNKAAKPWFLPEERSTDRMRMTFAAREIVAASPIIDGDAIFKALENAIDGATSSVLLAYWSLDIGTRMVTDSDRTWAQMLVDAAARGVKVRVLMTDFDPAGQTESHTGVWARLVRLLDLAGSQSIAADALQVVVSRQEAEVPAEKMKDAVPDMYDKVATSLNKQIADAKTRATAFRLSPGLWDKLTLDKSGKFGPLVAHKAYPAWPGSHHQKLAIIDGQFAFTGGVNIVSTYVDSSKHERPVDKAGVGPWHDAYVKVEGEPILRDLVTNYVGLWNQGKASMDAFLAAQGKALGSGVPPYASLSMSSMKEADITIAPAATKTTPPALPAQVRRTVSTKGTSAPYFTTVRQDIITGYTTAIGQASNFIYIENQYLREEAIGKAILANFAGNKKLVLIVVLPKFTEEKMRNSGDAISFYGSALQHGIVQDLMDTMKGNVGFYMMQRADNAVVYVHSKLIIIDDKYASIGSANANPRSMWMDSELDIAWFDPKSVADLRLKLWNEMLGNPRDVNSWKPTDFIKKWNAIADANAKATPAKLKGFVRRFENDVAGFKMPGVNLGPYS